MRRHISVCLAIVLISFGLPTKTYAATDGCPETWQLPELTFSMPGTDFQKYFPRTYDQIIKMGPTEFSFDNIKWQKSSVGVFPIQDPNISEGTYFLNNQIRSLILSGNEPKYGDDGIINVNLELIKYNQIYIKTAVTVEKKTCKPFTFFYTGKFDTPKIVYQDFSQEFSQISGFFRDYQSEEKAKNNYNKCLEDWKSLSMKRGKTIEVQKVCYLGSIFPFKGSPDETIFLNLIPFGKECLKFYQGNSNRSDGWQLAHGSNCKYAVVNSRDWNYYSTRTNDINFPKTIIVYQELFIKSVTSESSNLSDSVKIITCTKGKATKKVSGTNPKCPKGYKVKV